MFVFLQKAESPVRKDTGQTYISVDERSLDSFGIPKGFPLFAAWLPYQSFPDLIS